MRLSMFLSKWENPFRPFLCEWSLNIIYSQFRVVLVAHTTWQKKYTQYTANVKKLKSYNFKWETEWKEDFEQQQQQKKEWKRKQRDRETEKRRKRKTS